MKKKEIFKMEHTHKAMELMTGQWVYGAYHKHLPYTPNPVGEHVQESDYHHIIVGDSFSDWGMPRTLLVTEVDPDTVCKATGLKDKNGQMIYQKDITELEVNGEIRRFIVDIKPVKREVVSHPSFDDPTAKVVIMGVVFEWEGFELFPCVDENGVPDNEKMVIVGNVVEVAMVEDAMIEDVMTDE